MAILISVASGKGGVGKSVVAANLALALAKEDARFCWPISMWEEPMPISCLAN